MIIIDTSLASSLSVSMSPLELFSLSRSWYIHLIVCSVTALHSGRGRRCRSHTRNRHDVRGQQTWCGDKITSSRTIAWQCKATLSNPLGWMIRRSSTLGQESLEHILGSVCLGKEVLTINPLGCAKKILELPFILFFLLHIKKLKLHWYLRYRSTLCTYTSESQLHVWVRLRRLSQGELKEAPLPRASERSLTLTARFMYFLPVVRHCGFPVPR